MNHKTADVIKRYNDLLGKYREHLAESKKSGSGTVKWKHWELFQQNCQAGKDLMPPSTFESTKGPGQNITFVKNQASDLESNKDQYDTESSCGNDSDILIAAQQPKKIKKNKANQDDIIAAFLKNSNSARTEITSTLKSLAESNQSEISEVRSSIWERKRDIENTLNSVMEENNKMKLYIDENVVAIY